MSEVGGQRSEVAGRTSGLAAKVREAAAGYDGVFRMMDIVKVLDIRTYAEAKKVRGVVRDFMTTGEVIRVGEGRYVYGMRPYKRTLADVMWHLIRSHRQFTTDEVERLSGAGRAWVLEYLRGLRHAGILRQRSRGNWELVKDVGPERPV
jgi:hypothetical protein